MKAETLLAEIEELKRELRLIHAEGEPADGTETYIYRAGVYLSGVPYVWSSDAGRAFCFRDREQAARLIEKYPLALKGAAVGQFQREVDPSCSSQTTSG
jgi:hypothetical protein